MDISANGLSFLKKREGLELQAYNKDGVWTIGFGNTFYENGKPVQKGDTITVERANSLFNTIAKRFAKDVVALLTVKITQNQFDALVSLAYNIGIPRFKSSSLLKKVNINPADSSIKTEFLKWAYSQNKILSGLVNRRNLEADLYFSDYIIPFVNVPVKKFNILLIAALIGVTGVVYYTKAHKIFINWLTK
ncbi:lysozyme [Emticicia sp. W12TSBA100-4]|uniref:lysozyme n=1 Tax=Emticicia sp. W12TSBA100-4 TaxID=3160965 RepID=UPI0033055F70